VWLFFNFLFFIVSDLVFQDELIMIKTFCHDFFAPNVPLPSPKAQRWTPQSKQTIIHIIEQGYMTLPQAIHLYGLTVDEFLGWLGWKSGKR
jgi:hypothetical protein